MPVPVPVVFSNSVFTMPSVANCTVILQMVLATAARTLTEGLFGILPDALNDKLLIKPGFPTEWKFAKLSVPDISIDFKQDENITTYNINQSYNKLLNVTLQLKALKDKVVTVTVNGKPAKWKWMQNNWATND